MGFEVSVCEVLKFIETEGLRKHDLDCVFSDYFGEIVAEGQDLSFREYFIWALRDRVVEIVNDLMLDMDLEDYSIANSAKAIARQVEDTGSEDCVEEVIRQNIDRYEFFKKFKEMADKGFYSNRA